MDKLEKYRTSIKQLIMEYGQYRPSYGSIEANSFLIVNMIIIS
jgi:hypothetical protein